MGSWLQWLAGWIRRYTPQEALILLAWGGALWFAGCATTSQYGQSHLHGETPMMASWYGREQEHHLTACGARFDMYAFTAAHRTLPLGTILEVRNPANDKSVRVTIIDRGPYAHGRDLDLSYAAARDLEIITQGVARVYVSEVGHDSRYDHYWKGGVQPKVTDDTPPAAPKDRPSIASTSAPSRDSVVR